MSKRPELSTDFKLLQAKKLAKSTHDIDTNAGPYFGMTVPPVAERRQYPRSESTYQRLTSAVFED